MMASNARGKRYGTFRVMSVRTFLLRGYISHTVFLFVLFLAPFFVSAQEVCPSVTDVLNGEDTNFDCEDGVVEVLEDGDARFFFGPTELSGEEVTRVPFGIDIRLAISEDFFNASNTIALYKNEGSIFIHHSTVFDGESRSISFTQEGEYRIAVVGSTSTISIFDFSVSAFSLPDEIYTDSFEEDPLWETDDSEKFFFGADEEMLRALLENSDASGAPNKYLVRETNVNPNKSFFLSGEVRIDGIDKDGAVLFGIYSDDLTHTKTRFSTPGSTVNNKLLSFSNADAAFDFNVFNSDGDNLGSGGSGGSRFERERWYTFYILYDQENQVIHQSFVDNEEGTIYRSTIRDFEGEFLQSMRHIGVSFFPEGEPRSIFSAGQRADGSSEMSLDNVALHGTKAQSNVLFFPGIQGSRLYIDDFLSEDRLWEPGINSELLNLNMDISGNSIERVYTKDVIDRLITFGESVYGDFSNYLDNEVEDGVISEWQPFPYDWRHDVFEIVEKGTLLEDGSYARPTTTLSSLAATSDTGKVTIVAHSNGGLLTKALMIQLEEEGLADLVDQIIFIGVPQIGTPKSIGTILHGQDQEKVKGFLIDDDTAREVIRNMPGAYGLLPSEAYFNISSTPIISFRDFESTTLFRESYGDTISSHSALGGFITGEGDGRDDPSFSSVHEPLRGNRFLFDEAATQHNLLDTWEPSEDVVVHEVIGWGLPTPSGYEYREVTELQCVLGIFACEEVQLLKPFMQLSTSGDRTVMALSASAGDFEEWYINLPELNADADRDIEHADLTESPLVQEMISDFLKGETPNSPLITQTEPENELVYDVLSIHSPASVLITDEDGNSTGISEGEVSENIPNSFYFEVGDSKYVVVPKNTSYSTVITGEEKGSYVLDIDELAENELTDVEEISGIEVVEGSVSQLSKEGNTFSSLQVDTDGDGVVDTEISFVEVESAAEEIIEINIETSGLGRGSSVSLSQPERNIRVLGVQTERGADTKSINEVSEGLGIVTNLIQNLSLNNEQRKVVILYLLLLIELLESRLAN